MVQRKVPTKLLLQPNHSFNHGAKKGTHKTEILIDVKNNRGADLKKKKMKKSGSIKRPKHPVVPLPPPPPPPLVRTATTPNYMKPTTSSDARKEQSQSQVSTRNPQTSPHTASLRRKSTDTSKSSASSCKREAKTLLARTLTKNPSFKPVRASTRKCSTVVLCENLDAQRATCSSTLKDCKFPAYLSLNDGGNESEGTSAIKVCPYTYCSLNGHHHAPVPPLKSFLSARRRTIKAQRSFKLGCLSPRRAKPVGDSDLIEEVNKDFFIEIYGNKDEDSSDVGGIDGSGKDSSIIDDEASADDQEERVLEGLSDAPICNNFDTHEDQNQEMVDDEGLPPPEMVEDERSLEFLTELLEESKPDVCFDEFEDSEGSDVDSGLNLDNDYDYDCLPAIEDVEPDPEAGAGDNCIIDNEFITESDSKDWCFDESLVDEVCQESYAESMNSDAFSSSDDGESSDSEDHLQSLNTMESPAPVQVQEEEAEPVCDEENHVSSETSFDNFNDQSLENEDSVKKPHSYGTPLKSTEAEMEEHGVTWFTAKPKKPVQESDELGSFNPRGPNFLPLEPGPEAEKVDLRHQDLDEKKNAEEWMVDYALRQVVTKLGPARKRKVALLVEAFEKVMPITKCDIQVRHNSAFDQARPIQACN